MSAPKIANYSTTVSSHKSVAEIQQILAQHGARRIMFENDATGDPISIAFAIPGPPGFQVKRPPIAARCKTRTRILTKENR